MVRTEWAYVHATSASPNHTATIDRDIDRCRVLPPVVTRFAAVVVIDYRRHRGTDDTVSRHHG